MSVILSARPTRKHGTNTALSVEGVSDCPFSLVVREAHVIFPILEAPGSGVRLPFRELGLPFAGAFTHRVVTHFQRQMDRTERGRSHEEVAFDWSAQSRWLPDFHGVLRFRIETSRTRVILSGEYLPPFGILGALFDHFVGRRVARATAADVIKRLARALEARWAAERKA
jgi:hypothetical protein